MGHWVRSSYRLTELIVKRLFSCVLGEMFWRRPILPGTSDLDQLEKIWLLCGTPNQHSWPNFDALPGCEGVKRFNIYHRRLKQTYERLVETMLQWSCNSDLIQTYLSDDLVLVRRLVTSWTSC